MGNGWKHQRRCLGTCRGSLVAFLSKKNSEAKGVPDQESCTGGWLVSPGKYCEIFFNTPPQIGPKTLI